MFKLSKRSLSELEGVNQKLVDVVKYAIDLTCVDFGITDGLRTKEEQQEMVKNRASSTMNSKHLTGNAVDVAAFIGSRLSWEVLLYDDIANAFRTAATELDTPIRWGAAWHFWDIREWGGSMESLMNQYVDLRRSQNRTPFVDACHFELSGN